ncbi:MAG: GrpB family protein [Coriobacteriia bacterium]|nr:GrpB family protein [Coriobacteriia bacterium]
MADSNRFETVPDDRDALACLSLQQLWQLFPIKLVPPDPAWAENYQEMVDYLQKGLQGFRVERISHVGSTAVPGLWAKPIVDILVELSAGEDMAAATQRLQDLGFTCMAQRAGRASFNWGYTLKGFASKVYHLHLRFAGDNDELYFRDYLAQHAHVAQEYAALKLSLWREYEHDRDAYTAAKTDFIQSVVDRAKREYGRRY